MSKRPRGAIVALALASVAAAALYVYAGRGTTFYFDEWNFILGRRGGGLDVFLTAHNGHLSLGPVLVYKLYLQIFGLDHYLPYRLTVLALHIVNAWLLFAFALRRVASPVALAAAVVLLFFGTGFENILWPFQIGYLASIAFGMTMLLALDRDRNIAATVALLGSIACSGIGLAFLAGLLVRVLYRDRRRQALRIAAIPVATYLAWYLAYGDSQSSYETIAQAPQFAADTAAAAFAGLAGLSGSWGQPLLLAAVAGCVIAIVRSGRLSADRATVLAIPLAFWIATGISRSGQSPPNSSRYAYVGAVLVLVAAVHWGRAARFNRAALGCLAALVAFSIAGNLEPLRSGARFFRDSDTFTRAELTAVQLAAKTVPEDYGPDSQRMPQVQAGPYLHARSDFGSPALDPNRLPSQSPQVRAAVDRVLTEAGQAAFVRGEVVERERCTVLGAPGRPTLRVSATAPGVSVHTSGGTTRVRLRRFGDSLPSSDFLVLRGSETGFLRIAGDRRPQPWVIEFIADRRTTVCGGSREG